MKRSTPFLILAAIFVAHEIFKDQPTHTTDPVVNPDIAVPPPIINGRQIVIPADRWNQCYFSGIANGKQFRFLLDSGAGEVSFGIKYATQLGFNPEKLRFDGTASTANGDIRVATIRLNELRLGSYVINNVKAEIDYTTNGTQNETPLLGASILKLVNFQLRNKACVLTLPEEPQKPIKANPASGHTSKSHHPS